MRFIKSQSSVELFLLFGVLIAFALDVYIINLNYQLSIIDKEASLNAMRISDTIENEVTIALKLGDGYERTFNLIPPTLKTDFYKISSLGEGVINIEWDRGSFSNKMPTKNITNGMTDKFEISVGQNKISNVNGEIIIEGVQSE